MATNETDALERAIKGVVFAWVDEGKAPGYHRQIKKKLGGEWATLYSALEHLSRSRPDLVNEAKINMRRRLAGFKD